jgi:hypothetical protein
MSTTDTIASLEVRRRIGLPLFVLLAGFNLFLAYGLFARYHLWFPGVMVLAQFAFVTGQLSLRFFRLTALGDGKIELHASWRNATVDLRQGFVLKQTRLHAKALLLEVGGKRWRLNGIGALDEVDAWLKRAMAYGV